ncbi:MULTISPECIES: DedA family protein [Bombella]|uniref:VTT domain-containing protein n=1 Tax=Bombella pollinis TaxID=2967337 RepID=A0ABT3WNI1_9PROT|nr:VTT domain-containing protein [Bombella pollinis]MCT6838001.1 VTT domain-containing protein [Bifidobacteriales bacterium]MCX5619307.1 VTT domain-containing protein [Bombella pollinis]
MIRLNALMASQPLWLKAFSIILGTFILEDVATVLAATAAKNGNISSIAALLSLYVGVVVGDVGLYGLGLAGSHWQFLRRFLTLPSEEQARKWFSRNIIAVVAIARFVPGVRLPLYTACGFFRAPFCAFALTAIAATLVWTSLLFLLSLHISGWLLAHKTGWRWAGIVGFVLCIFMMGRFIGHLQRRSHKS